MFTLTEDETESTFRSEVRAWIGQALPKSLRPATTIDDRLAIDRLLAEAGYLGFTWPKSFGGGGARPRMAAILHEELARAGASPVGSPSHQGIDIVGPTIIHHGSEQQKKTFLPRILAVEDLWCQGFSEPDAGSDLAGVQTRAEDRSGTWVISGTKIWTSLAQRANWIYVLARTGHASARYKNLTLFLVPMTSDGIEVMPITKLTGEQDFCQVRLTDVEVRGEDVLGDVGKGWNVAMWALGTERLSGRLRYFRFRREAADLAIQLSRCRDHPMYTSWLVEFGRRFADIEALRPLLLKTESMAEADVPVDGLPSVAKIWWPLAHQGLCELGIRLEAADVGAATDGYWYFRWLEARAESIYGGSVQIQRNILSERWLGLPRG